MFYKRIASYLFKYPMPIWKLVYKQLVKAVGWKQGVNEKTFLAKPPDNQMVGLEHNGKKQTSLGGGCMFNMILKDGTRSDNAMNNYGQVVVRQRYDYFLPQNNRITKVIIYYIYYIRGFRFHLSDGSNWDIGRLDGKTVTIEIADNEVIVGFNSKSEPDCPANYVEWQFITAQGLRFN